MTFPAVALGGRVDTHQESQTGRVDELKLAQVDDDAPEPAGPQFIDLLLQPRGGGDIELADRHHAHPIGAAAKRAEMTRSLPTNESKTPLRYTTERVDRHTEAPRPARCRAGKSTSVTPTGKVRRAHPGAVGCQSTRWVFVILADTLTKGERKLSAIGRGDFVMESRKVFQSAMREDMSREVEALTGRKVVAFLSDNYIDPDVGLEAMMLESRPTEPGDPAS